MEAALDKRPEERDLGKTGGSRSLGNNVMHGVGVRTGT